jgi:acyl-homoserine-lactone acylase
MYKYVGSFLILALLAGCGSSNNNNDQSELENQIEVRSYKATVQRTQYGIPHITAENYGDMGFGYGYAYAQDNYCVLMKEIVRANGESELYLDDGDLNKDLVYKLVNSDEFIEDELLPSLSSDFSDLLSGFAAGMNKHFQQTGVDNLATGDEGCKGANWAREITQTDMGKALHKLILVASTDPLADFIVGRDGPTQVTAGASKAQNSQQVAAKNVMPSSDVLASNAYALGSEVTESGTGLLLGNPHFPWAGSRRFYMVHLTIPGVYDAMGASLHGFPLVNIGFNDSVAWTHTVSTASRFTAYELTLDPNDPFRYEYDGGFKDITEQTVIAQQINANGDIEDIEHTFYLSEYGPLIGLGSWPAGGKLYALRDANIGNLRGFDFWDGIGKAGNMNELLEATKTIGNPWTNTIAVDKFGEALYSDISTVPNVTTSQIDRCASASGNANLIFAAAGAYTLDGSLSECQWGSDADAPVEGVFGFNSLPKLQTKNHSANANDSYWLAALDKRLTGFSPIIGEESYEQTLRTRITFDQLADRFSGADNEGVDGKFTTEILQKITFSNRNYAAELVLDDAVEICSAQSDWSSYTDNIQEVAEACTILGTWDGTSNIDAVGTHIFREFWDQLKEVPTRANDPVEIFAQAFDPNDPVNTPNTLDVSNPTVAEEVKKSLGKGVDILIGAGIELDKQWGEIQYVTRNGENIPIHGGTTDTSFGVISSRLVDGEGYSDIRAGNSYMQTVTWENSASSCPEAFAILTYSQSSDPESPHYSDQTKLYSNKKWIDMPYCAEDITAMAITEAEEITN